MNKCPTCGIELIISEDWDFGRVYICEKGHIRKVERFDGHPTTDILDEPEKEQENAA